MSKPRKSDAKDTSISSKLLGVNVSDINIEKFRDINTKREKYALKGNFSVPILKSVSNKFSPLVIFAITLPGQGIASIEALTECINLMVVNLSQNLIDSLMPLKGLTEIKVADFSQNNLSNVDGLNACANLVNIHLEGNRIKSVDALRALKNIPTLKSIHLQTLSGDLQNPICAQGSYRIAILDNFDRLRRLDCLLRDSKNFSNGSELDKASKKELKIQLKSSGPFYTSKFPTSITYQPPALQNEDSFKRSVGSCKNALQQLELKIRAAMTG